MCSYVSRDSRLFQGNLSRCRTTPACEYVCVYEHLCLCFCVWMTVQIISKLITSHKSTLEKILIITCLSLTSPACYWRNLMFFDTIRVLWESWSDLRILMADFHPSLLICSSAYVNISASKRFYCLWPHKMKIQKKMCCKKRLSFCNVSFWFLYFSLYLKETSFAPH